MRAGTSMGHNRESHLLNMRQKDSCARNTRCMHAAICASLIRRHASSQHEFLATAMFSVPAVEINGENSMFKNRNMRVQRPECKRSSNMLGCHGAG